MREPYVELGIAIVGQAIRDWKKESEACNYITKDNARLRKIANFLKGDLAKICMEQIDVDPVSILENLEKENTEKRIELALREYGGE